MREFISLIGTIDRIAPIVIQEMERAIDKEIECDTLAGFLSAFYMQMKPVQARFGVNMQIIQVVLQPGLPRLTTPIVEVHSEYYTIYGVAWCVLVGCETASIDI